MKTLGITLLLLSLSGLAFAGVAPVPEISPATGGAAIALVSGLVLVIRARRKK